MVASMVFQSAATSGLGSAARTADSTVSKTAIVKE
jgi:hypothetical protein